MVTRATREQVLDLLTYDPNTGIFTWNVSRNWKVKAGDVAGGINSDGYRIVKLLGVGYMAHVLAWLVMTGSYPKTELDHKNGGKDDNSWHNLRLASRKENMQNFSEARKNNGSGLLGVSWYKKYGKWIAQIQADGKKKNLGYFDDKNEAHFAYMEAKKQLHPFNIIKE